MRDHEESPSRSSQSAHILFAMSVVLLLALGVRLVALGRPLVGNFATKNVVYGMIARNLVEGRAELWLPTVDCLRGGERGLHLLEVPVSAYLAGGAWKIFGGSLDVWGRLVSIGFSLGSILVLFDFVRRRHGATAALGAAAVLAFSPVSVIYGQSFMLEASIVFFAVATIDALDRWLIGRRTAWLVVSVVCFGLLVLTKIYMLVLLLPIVVMLAGRMRARTHQQAASKDVADHEGFSPDTQLAESTCPPCLNACKHASYVGWFVLAALPAVGWVLYVMHSAAPEGHLADRVFYSLCDSTEAHRPPHPLLWQADFYRQLFDDLAGVMLTPVAFLLPIIGVTDRQWRRYLPWLVAMGLLVAAMPRKFYEMNYYCTILMPPLAILAGLGWARLVGRLRLSRWAVAGFLTLGLVVSMRYTIVPVLQIPVEDRAVLPAAQAIAERAAAGEPVVTIHGSGIDLLYYCDRPGWAIEPNDSKLAERLTECAAAGAKLLVIVDVESHASPDRDGRLAGARPLVEGDGFRVYRLPVGKE
jgi:hypothetical protein